MAADDTVTKPGRRWIVRTGPLQRNVWLLRDFRLFEGPPRKPTEDGKSSVNWYQLAYKGKVGREFQLCVDMTDDQLQAMMNQEADEVQMDAGIAAGL
jgi:hypothetical protein